MIWHYRVPSIISWRKVMLQCQESHWSSRSKQVQRLLCQNPKLQILSPSSPHLIFTLEQDIGSAKSPTIPLELPYLLCWSCVQTLLCYATFKLSCDRSPLKKLRTLIIRLSPFRKVFEVVTSFMFSFVCLSKSNIELIDLCYSHQPLLWLYISSTLTT